VEVAPGRDQKHQPVGVIGQVRRRKAPQRMGGEAQGVEDLPRAVIAPKDGHLFKISKINYWISQNTPPYFHSALAMSEASTSSQLFVPKAA
jgi:hypothetical protein